MKILGHILLIITSALLTCCTPPGVDRELDRAEALMWEAPDSALTILQGITLPSYVSSGSRARHALLLSQALDKNYIDLTSDSLILIAERHYEHSSSLRPLMLSYFYHGRILYNAADYPRSLFFLTKSLDCAEKLNDDFWQGRCCQQISDIYQRTFHNSEALPYAEKACKFFELCGNTKFYNYALINYARALSNNDRHDDAVEVLDILEFRAKEDNDSLLTADGLKLKADCYHFMHRYADAIKAYNQILSSNVKQDRERYKANLGLSYLYSGQIAEAMKLASDTIKSEDLSYTLFTYETAKLSKNYPLALEIHERLIELFDSIYDKSINLEYGNVLSDIHSLEKEKHALEHNNLRLRILIGVTTAVCLIVTMTFLFWKHHRRQQETINNKILIAQNLKEILGLKDNEIENARNRIQKLLATKYEQIDAVCKIWYENVSAKTAKKNVAEAIDSLVSDMTTNTEKVSEIESIVNESFNGIMNDFRQDFPGLKEADYLLYMYSVLGFSTSAIALLLKEEKVDAVYNRKARLKAKIKTLPKEKQGRYLEVFG